MVPGGFEALSEARAARARLLAERYPASRDVLSFVAEIAALQGAVATRAASFEALVGLREPLLAVVRMSGPEALRTAADGLDDSALRAALIAYRDRSDTSSLRSFFARVLLQTFAAASPSGAAAGERSCPRCGHRPQVGVLRAQGHGNALSLVCSLCLHEWPFGRGQCAACGAESTSLAYYTADELPHLRVHACDSCKRYLHAVDLAAEPDAIADVDELVALPLDVWARERDYAKLQPNLAGI